MITRIHVNQHVIRANKKHGTNHPVLTVKQGGGNRYCRSRVVYSPDKPLSCGFRVWIETEAEVTLDPEEQP